MFLLLEKESIKMALIHFTQLIFISRFFFSSNTAYYPLRAIVIHYSKSCEDIFKLMKSFFTDNYLMTIK